IITFSIRDIDVGWPLEINRITSGSLSRSNSNCASSATKRRRYRRGVSRNLNQESNFDTVPKQLTRPPRSFSHLPFNIGWSKFDVGSSGPSESPCHLSINAAFNPLPIDRIAKFEMVVV